MPKYLKMRFDSILNHTVDIPAQDISYISHELLWHMILWTKSRSSAFCYMFSVILSERDYFSVNISFFFNRPFEVASWC